jgi:hypothetical protein
LQQMLLALDKPALRREEFREPYPKASRPWCNSTF